MIQLYFTSLKVSINPLLTVKTYKGNAKAAFDRTALAFMIKTI